MRKSPQIAPWVSQGSSFYIFKKSGRGKRKVVGLTREEIASHTRDTGGAEPLIIGGKKKEEEEKCFFIFASYLSFPQFGSSFLC